MPVKELDKLTLTDLWKDVNDEETIWGDLKLETRHALKTLMETSLMIGITRHLNAASYERTPDHSDYRNGYYKRSLETAYGLIENIVIPRRNSSYLLGFSPSAQTVSNVLKGLDGEVNKYHRRRLSDHYIYLFFDAVVLKARSALEVAKRFVLCAYGITLDGKKELIAFRQAPSESEAA